MPLSKDDKKSIISYRIEKARKTMVEARDCAAMGHWSLAANRLYYSLFYISNALLVDKGLFAKTHAGIIAKINEHFVKTGILYQKMREELYPFFRICVSLVITMIALNGPKKMYLLSLKELRICFQKWKH